MRYQAYLLLVFFSVAMISCTKENLTAVEAVVENITQENLFDLWLDDDQRDGLIRLTATGAQISQTPKYRLTAAFEKDGLTIPVEEFKVGNLPIETRSTAKGDGTLYEMPPFSVTGEPRDEADISRHFGALIPISLQSRELGDFTRDFETLPPIRIDIYSANSETKKMDRNSDFTIKWKIGLEDQVGFRSNIKTTVGIILTYMPDEWNRPDQPKTGKSIHKIADSADQQVTFGPEDLARFPEGPGKVYIVAGIATQEWATTSLGKKIRLLNYNYALQRMSID